MAKNAKTIKQDNIDALRGELNAQRWRYGYTSFRDQKIHKGESRTMIAEEKRRIVSEGLERRKMDRIQKETQLEEQARQLRLTINGNHTNKTMSDVQREQMKELARKQMREARAKERAAEVAREMAAMIAIRRYSLICLLVLLLRAFTRMPIWGAAALIFGLAVFPVVYIYRLYVPIVKK